MAQFHFNTFSMINIGINNGNRIISHLFLCFIYTCIFIYIYTYVMHVCLCILLYMYVYTLYRVRVFIVYCYKLKHGNNKPISNKYCPQLIDIIN